MSCRKEVLGAARLNPALPVPFVFFSGSSTSLPSSLTSLFSTSTLSYPCSATPVSPTGSLGRGRSSCPMLTTDPSVSPDVVVSVGPKCDVFFGVCALKCWRFQ